MSKDKENQFEENVNNLCKLLSQENIMSCKVKHFDCIAGSSSGDNYMSVVKRVLIVSESKRTETAEWYEPLDAAYATGVSNRKDILTYSLIVKRQIASLSRRALYRCDEAFNNEINAYKHMVPLLEQYTNSDMFTPKCYYAGKDDNGEIIILEDLKASGYSMHNRLVGLDVHYCELVMKNLAKFHAASIAAKQLNNKVFREKCQHVQEIVYCKEAEEFYKNIFETSIRESLLSLRCSNEDDSISEATSLIEKLQSQMYAIVQKCITHAKEKLSVICHGDLWVNNIMFKTSTGSSADVSVDSNSSTASSSAPPSDVRFFDLQAMRYTSPVFDILHFFYTSTKRDLRDAHTLSLLETYCAALYANLEQQFSEPHTVAQLQGLRETFSLRNITEEYYENVLYGLAISMWILPAVTFDPKHIPNLDAISETTSRPSDIKCTQMLTPEYHSRLKDLVLEFYENGYLSEHLKED